MMRCALSHGKIHTPIIVVGVFLLGVPDAQAQSQSRVVTGLKLDYLLQDCKKHEGSTDDDLCGGYIGGGFDQLALAGVICPPENFLAHDIIATGRSYLMNHAVPANVHPSFLLKQAFQEAYPCKSD